MTRAGTPRSPWRPEYGRAYQERKRLGLRSTYHNALTWEERFWRRVDTTAGMDGCWLWLGKKNRQGYGMANVSGPSTTTAHRDAYLHLVGPIPDDLELDHLCRNRACVNPAHLEVVTHRENSRRASHWWGTKTHCVNGHEFTPENTQNRPTGGRVCRACSRATQARYRARRAA